jgi:protein-S-isoprenylcysteine O-methyltransferase Ste14
MTRWGVGPRFALYSVIYCGLMFWLTRYFDPRFKITFVPHRMLVWIGLILMVVGIPFYLFSLVSVMRAFNAGRLVTRGAYGMCRHPVYAAWVVFLVPGLALLLNSWALLTAPFVMYFLARTLVHKEELYLEGKFCQEYLAYKQKVPAILPVGGLKMFTGK